MDGRISKAWAQALETDNHCDEWVRAAVAVRGDDILADAPKIEQDEAWRRVHRADREAEYRQIAHFAAARHNLNPDAVVRMLRSSDELPYRLLEEAKNTKRRRS